MRKKRIEAGMEESKIPARGAFRAIPPLLASSLHSSRVPHLRLALHEQSDAPRMKSSSAVSSGALHAMPRAVNPKHKGGC